MTAGKIFKIVLGVAPFYLGLVAIMCVLIGRDDR